jgi:hypothetical protein
MNNLQELIGVLIDLISSVIPVLASLTLLVFLWGITKFIMKTGDQKAVDEGKKLMIWGLVGLFVMMSFMSIITFFRKDTNLDGSKVYPLLPGAEENQN